MYYFSAPPDQIKNLKSCNVRSADMYYFSAPPDQMNNLKSCNVCGADMYYFSAPPDQMNWRNGQLVEGAPRCLPCNVTIPGVQQSLHSICCMGMLAAWYCAGSSTTQGNVTIPGVQQSLHSIPVAWACLQLGVVLTTAVHKAMSPLQVCNNVCTAFQSHGHVCSMVPCGKQQYTRRDRVRHERVRQGRVRHDRVRHDRVRHLGSGMLGQIEHSGVINGIGMTHACLQVG